MTSAPAAYPNASQTFNATAVAPVIEPAPVPTAAVYAPTQSVYNATAAPVQVPTGSGRGFFPSCDDVFSSFSLFFQFSFITLLSYLCFCCLFCLGCLFVCLLCEVNFSMSKSSMSGCHYFFWNFLAVRIAWF